MYFNVHKSWVVFATFMSLLVAGCTSTKQIVYRKDLYLQDETGWVIGPLKVADTVDTGVGNCSVVVLSDDQIEMVQSLRRTIVKSIEFDEVPIEDVVKELNRIYNEYHSLTREHIILDLSGYRNPDPYVDSPTVTKEDQGWFDDTEEMLTEVKLTKAQEEQFRKALAKAERRPPTVTICFAEVPMDVLMHWICHVTHLATEIKDGKVILRQTPELRKKK